ncbi:MULTISPECIES: GAF domain-containing sensor histidine kinase [Myxococcaceae]|uniref:sensor histidine kinase n=1 Tax=Myxococcaceae TaxID=31 RepID=UPI0018905061|nr:MULTISPECIES: GAF domain-containing sensor histidine kinase [Myxococcaceae]MBF5042188.1 GAF domain-containing protein [Simulacricoccus sp. 17bor-14]
MTTASLPLAPAGTCEPPRPYAARLFQLAAALSEALTSEQVADTVLAHAVPALGGAAGMVWATTPEGDAAFAVGERGNGSEAFERWRRLPLTRDFPLGDAMLGRTPVWLESREALFARYPAVAARGASSIEREAWLLLPLVLEGRVLGALSFGFAAPQRFSPEEREVAGALAHLCAQALERARLHAAQQAARERAERAADRALRLQRLTAALSTAATPLEVTGVVLEHALEVQGTRGAAAWELGREEGVLTLLRAARYPDSTLERFRRVPLAAHAPIAEAARTGGPVWIASREDCEQRFPEAAVAVARTSAQFSSVSLPLLVDGSVAGVLAVSFEGVHPFEPEEQGFLCQLATHCAHALARARLYREAQEARERTERLQALTGALSRAVSAEQVAAAVVAEAQRASGAPRVGVWVRRPAGDQLHLLHGYGMQAVQALPIELSDDAPTAQALARGEALWFSGIEELERTAPAFSGHAEATGEGRRAMLPLLGERGLQGFLTLGWDTPSSFSAVERALFEAIARQCAQALERAALFSAERALREAAEADRRELERERTRLELAVRAAELGIWEYDVRADQHSWDARCRSLFWLAPDAPIGGFEGFLACVHPEDRAPLQGLMDQLLDPAGPERYEAEYRVLGAAGEQRWVRGTGRRHLEAGRLVRLAGTMQDVTERRRAAQEREALVQELGEAVRLRDEFLAVASHELNTPLTSLKLQVALLARASEGDARARQRLQVVDRQLVRLSERVGGLLDVSRIRGGRLELRPAPMDLRAAAQGALERLGGLLEQAGCAVSLEAPLPVEGSWDVMRVGQVLENLLTNAAKYGAGTPVQVRVAAAADGGALLEVQDGGIGIAPEDLPRIFGLFERAVSVRHYGGLGLGLYITQQLVSAMGGRVEAHSRPAEGSTFRVWLPRSGAPVPLPSRCPEEGGHPG